MDLIYADSTLKELGVLDDFDLDMAIGESENDFEIKVTRANHCLKAGYYVYIPGTEYGGVIDSIESKSNTGEVYYIGRTWTGMLENKIIVPNIGEDYLTVSGNANAVLTSLIDRIGLNLLFDVEPNNSPIEIKNFQFDRYTDAYSGIVKMLSAGGGKLKIAMVPKKKHTLTIWAEKSIDYSKDEQFSNDLVDTDILKKCRPVNHMICLGQGELKERQVIHLYADQGGAISKKQTLFGIDEVVSVYDYSSAESLEVLEKGGIDKLREEQQGVTKIDFTADSDNYDIGDTIGTKDEVTGVSVVAKITKKIVTIEKETISIQYNVGE